MKLSMSPLTIGFLLTAAIGTGACSKDKAKPASPDDVAKPTDLADADDVPQEPDPPEIEQAAHAYLVGDFQAAIDILEPMVMDLKERSQYRASGLAAGWLAVAHAKLVFENAEEPALHALAMAEKTGDAEVVAVAKLGHGAWKLGGEKYDAAAKAFDEAAAAAPSTIAGALANVLRAETRIGSAFGHAESNELVNPQELETARKAYEAATKTANEGIETSLILGRVEEGLAAIARYQNNREKVCAHAYAAIEHYRAGGANEFMIEGPSALAHADRCEPPKGS
jgi:hypothetical protein